MTGFVGRSVQRREDRRLLLGAGRYVADIELPGLAHAAFLRSDLARARVLSVDTAAAEAQEGVVAVYVGGRFVDTEPPSWQTFMGPAPDLPFRPLAGDEVRYVGEPIALVLAADRYLAEDACELIDVEFDPLDPVMADDDDFTTLAGRVHSERATNLVVDTPMTGRATDLEEVFATVAHVVEVDIDQVRSAPAPMECRGLIASWDPVLEHLDLTMSTQSVHEARSFLSRYLGLSEHQIDVRVNDVGGAFGQKKVRREEVAIILAAQALAGTVKWVEDRRENLLAATHGRNERAHVRMAIDTDGMIQAMTLAEVVDAGAYPSNPHGMYNTHVTGAYKIPRFAMSTQSRFSNTMGRGSYRAPGMFETTAREITMDIAARALQLDPVELRRRHLLHAEDLPYDNAHGKTLDEITPSEAFERVLTTIGYDGFRAEQQAERRRGRHLGLGVSVHLAAFAKAGLTYSSDAATVRFELGGDATVFIGLTDQGMSLGTTMAQIAADQLGIDVERVRIVHGNTSTPFGGGAGGSKSAVISGGAVHMASLRVREKMLAIAAHALEAAPEDLVVADGRVSVRGSSGVGLDIADVTRLAYVDPSGLPPEIGAGLEATERFRPARYPTWSNAAHACIVEVDLATCRTEILRYAVVEDCGRVINPMVVAGQTQGAIVQGIGGVLYEQFLYDDIGNPLTSTFVDYLLPTAAEAPEVELELLETPSTTNPGGHKGVAESGSISAPAAVVNAIADALSPYGVDLTSTRLGPGDLFEVLARAGALSPTRE